MLFSLIFTGKNYWLIFTFIFVVLLGILYLRFTIIDDAIQELTLPKQEILKNIDFFLSKIKLYDADDSVSECVICMEDFKKDIGQNFIIVHAKYDPVKKSALIVGKKTS